MVFTLCYFVVYSTRRFVLCLTLCHFVLVFFSPFSIAISSLGEERATLIAFRTFVRFVLVWICRFPLPLGVWEGLRFVIVALPGLFSYPLLFFLQNGFWTLRGHTPWACPQGLLLVLFFVALWFILRGDLFYILPCVILFLCCSVLLVLRFPRLGKRELILVLFVCLFDLCLFGFVGFLFLLVSGKGCGL